jgi:hypothetical protein
MVERYLEPLAQVRAASSPHPHIEPRHRISRVGFDKLKTKGRESAPFELRYQNGKGPEVVQGRCVIDVSGTWHSPNPGGRQRPPRHRRDACRGQDRLRHA